MLEAERKSTSENKYRDELITQRMCTFLAKNGLPPDVVTDPCFIKMVKSLNKNYNIPGPVIIENKVSAIGRKLNANEEAKKYVTVTTDVVSLDGSSFLVLSIHYFSGKSKLKSCKIHIKKLKNSGANLVDIITEIKKPTNWDNESQLNIVIKEKQHENTCSTFRIKGNIFTCFNTKLATLIQSIIQLPVIHLSIKQIEHFVITIENEWKHEFEMFVKRICDKDSISPELRTSFELPKEMINSEWTEICRYLVDWYFLDEIFAQFASDYHILYIPSTVVNILSSITNMLSSFAKISDEMAQENTTVSHVLPKVKTIAETIMKSTQNKELSENITKLISTWEQTIQHEPLWGQKKKREYEIATFLDPTFAFSDKVFTVEEWKNISDYLHDEIVNTTNLPNETLKSVFTDSVQKQLNHYKEKFEKSKTQIVDPIIWWIDEGKKLLHLYDLAMQYLMIPASSINGKMYIGNNERLSHLLKTSDDLVIESYLELAFRNETFKGRGSQQEVLNNLKRNANLTRILCQLAEDEQQKVPKEEEQKVEEKKQEEEEKCPIKIEIDDIEDNKNEAWIELIDVPKREEADS